MAIDDNTGIQLPGSDEEQYAYGLDYRGLQGDTPTGGYPGIGGTENGLDVSGGSINNPGVGTDGSSLFNDSQIQIDQGGMDSMQGVSGLDGIHVEQLSGEQMYAEQASLPFEFPLGESAEPLIEP